MRNPFQYGGVVGGPAFCNRTQEIADLLRAANTQHLCHALWELCDPGKAATLAMMREAVQVLLERESYAYTALWESLTLTQRRLLTGLASEAKATKVFSSGFLQLYGLGSGSSAQRAVAALIDRDAIDRDNGSLVIADRFFRIWIQRMHLQ